MQELIRGNKVFWNAILMIIFLNDKYVKPIKERLILCVIVFLIEIFFDYIGFHSADFFYPSEEDINLLSVFINGCYFKGIGFNIKKKPS